MSSLGTRRARSAKMPRATKKSSAQTTGRNAASDRTHMSGVFRTRCFFSLNEVRL